MRLPDFIFKAVSEHNTSVGNNDAFPQREDVSFDYVILKHRFEQIIEEIEKEFEYVPTPVEAENMLNKLIRKTIKIEEPLRPQLEKLCEAIVNNVLGIPQETILLDCELVDRVEPDNELRIMPEDDEDEPMYTFDDVDELNHANKAILKRRLVNTLVQGASYLLSMDFFDNGQVSEWSDQLEPLYTKIMALNDYLLFVKKEEITDKNPMLGAYVETHLGEGDEKTVISAQGLIFPLLLQETFRGLFELFASHGLPQDNDKANYIIHHADFIMAEAWDLRIGVPLWERIENCSDYRPLPNMYPYIMSSLVQQKLDVFNDTMKNIFAGTKKGKDYLNNIINQIKHDAEYNLFKQDMEHFNLEKCVINDEDNQDEDDVIEEGVKKIANNVLTDKNGNPLVCYHSTTAKFNTFDPNKINSGGAGCYHGFGFNFTTKPNTTYGGNIIEAHLTANKPLWDKKKTINLNKLIKILIAIDKGEQDSIVCNFTGNNPKIGGQGYWYEIHETAKSILDYAEGDLDIYANICTAANCGVHKVIDVFSRLGYDSAIETYDDGTPRVVVVFHIEQIQIISEPLVKESLIRENKYDQAFNDACSAFENFKKEGAKKYGIDTWYAFGWMKVQHPEIQIDPADISKYKELEGNLEKISKLWNQGDSEEEETQANTGNQWAQEQANLIDLAVKEFGTTGRLSQAGYILPDGRLLNFGQDGERGTDHRAIEGIYKRNSIKIWNEEYRYNYVVDFLNHGAIRIDAENGTIDMTMEPTNAEYKVLKDIVRRTDGEAYVDFTNNQGNVMCSVEYDHVTPQRIVQDIHRYYQEGMRPQGDFYEEGKKSNKVLKEDINFKEWFQGSKVVNPDGSPKIMYRGDNNQIDTFDRRYSSSNNLYGTGFYFTDSKNQALTYGNIQPYFLRIIHPLRTTAHEITKQQLIKFLGAVDKDEDYGIYNYGQGSTVDTVFEKVWGKSDFAMIQDINATCIGDMVKATELFNKINKTDFDGFILPSETVVFDNIQIRKANKPLYEVQNYNNVMDKKEKWLYHAVLGSHNTQFKNSANGDGFAALRHYGAIMPYDNGEIGIPVIWMTDDQRAYSNIDEHPERIVIAIPYNKRTKDKFQIFIDGNYFARKPLPLDDDDVHIINAPAVCFTMNDDAYYYGCRKNIAKIFEENSQFEEYVDNVILYEDILTNLSDVSKSQIRSWKEQWGNKMRITNLLKPDENSEQIRNNYMFYTTDDAENTYKEEYGKSVPLVKELDIIKTGSDYSPILINCVNSVNFFFAFYGNMHSDERIEEEKQNIQEILIDTLHQNGKYDLDEKIEDFFSNLKSYELNYISKFIKSLGLDYKQLAWDNYQNKIVGPVHFKGTVSDFQKKFGSCLIYPPDGSVTDSFEVQFDFDFWYTSKDKQLQQQFGESKQNNTEKQIVEYLDKDYMKPLFDYLRNGERYSSGGYYNATERLIVPFFEWCRTRLNDDEWSKFAKTLRNCQALKGRIQPGEFMGRHTIDCYSQMSNGLKQVKTSDFLKQNAKHIFNITYNKDPELAQFWDKFMTQFINTEDGTNMLKGDKSLDADTVLMNPELKKTQWLIHLTPNKNDALDIVQNGFKYGLGKNQMSKLGYTNNGIKKENKQGKYLYAFNAEEIANGVFPTDFIVKNKAQHKYDKPFDQKIWEYASQFAIMFTAPGVQAYHGTDKQNQVIFNANMAHNFVLLTRGKDFIWQVINQDNKPVYQNKSLTDVVVWVINNYRQYQKQICWRK